MNDNQLAVFDLDGTVVRGNTLHIYIRAGARAMLRQRRLGAFARLLGIMTLRRLKLVSHRTMKFAALRLIAPDERLRRDFTAAVARRRNPAVTALIESARRRGMVVLLATAAPDVYVPWIWADDFIATPVAGNPSRRELRGTLKLQAVSHYAAARGLRLALLATDHRDDLPLITAGIPEIYLVNPDPATRLAVGLTDTPVTLIP